MSEPTRYQWLKENGICVQCGQRDAFPGYVRCPECIEKGTLASAKCWSEKEKRIKYNMCGAERKKQLRNGRKKNHLCVMCGRNLGDKYDGTTCKQCRERRNAKRRTGISCGEKFRKRIELGVCMYCGETVVPGYKLCEKHLKQRTETIHKSIATSSQKWRGEIEKQWENAKAKSSVNG